MCLKFYVNFFFLKKRLINSLIYQRFICSKYDCILICIFETNQQIKTKTHASLLEFANFSRFGA